MKTLVIYDSAFGNTAKVADAISDSLQPFGDSKSSLISDVKYEELQQLDYLFIGSPTQGGRPTKLTSEFIDELPKQSMTSTKLAVFDTRFKAKDQTKALQALMKVIGYAAPKMARALKRKSLTVVSNPQGFIVNEKEGPIAAGEIKRATLWAKEIVNT